MARNATFLIIGVLVATVAARASAFDITECGQTVPSGETGFLQTDLDCPLGDENTSTASVILQNKATLNLNSRTLNGGSYGVSCVGERCAVRGTGVISGSSRYAIIANSNRVDVFLVEFRDIPGRAIRMNVFDVTRTKVNVGLSTFANIGQGLAPNPAHLAAIVGGKVKIENSTFIDCAIGAVDGFRVRGKNVTLTDNQFGIASSSSLQMTNLKATGHDEPAVSVQLGVALRNSALSDNGQSGDGVDILSPRRPKLKLTSCSRSQVCLSPPVFGPPCEPQAATWGVCANDF